MKHLLLILLLALPAYADTHTAINCEESGAGSIGAALSDAASDTDATVTVVWPAGTCNWTAPVTFTVNANTTTLVIRGAGSTSIIGGNDQTVIIDDYQNANPLLSIETGASTTRVVNVYGFTIQGGTSGGNVKSGGILTIGGSSHNFQLHHFHINVQTYNTVVPNAGIRFTGDIQGVIHNAILDLHSTGNGIQQYQSGSGNTFGDQPWADATNLGGSDAVYVEDSQINVNSYFGAANDCLHGGKFVFRYNTLDLASLQTHPTGGDGRVRGCRKWEVYGNAFVDTLETSVKDNVFWASSGTGVVWGNSALLAEYQSFTVLKSMRQTNGTYGRANTPIDWGFCGRGFLAGTVTASGTSITKTSGNDWIGGSGQTAYYIDPGATINISGTDYTVATITDGTHLTVTAGTPANGDSYIISNWDGNSDADTGYPCLDMPGRGEGDLLSGDFPDVINTENGNATASSPDAWPRQALEPLYEWENTYGAGRWSPDAGIGLTQNVDYYTTADGGVTVGTSRPGTCTVGQAYWETDEGDWRTAVPTEGIAYMGQGILYKCTAMDTWTLFYEPLTYPHPLRTDGDTTNPTPGNSGTLTTSNVASTSLTLNWTEGTDDVSAQAALQYEVRQSSTNNIDTVANAEANGSIAQAYTADISSANISGLSASTTYWFNVIVKDEAGNKAAYTQKSQATTAAAASTGAGGLGRTRTRTR